MKKCFKCGEQKQFSEFYKHSRMADGYLGKCKQCTKNDVSNHRTLNIEKVKEYDRNRPNHEERIARNREYAKTERGKLAQKIGQKRIREKFPEKKLAWSLFSSAVKLGKIKKKPCEKCGNKIAQGHHEDYSKPLDVIWLCTFHHVERHREINKERRMKRN